MPATIMPVTESDAIAVSGRYEYGDSVPPGVPTKPEAGGAEYHLRRALGFYDYVQLGHGAQFHRDEREKGRCGCLSWRGLDWLTGRGSRWSMYWRCRFSVLGMDAASCADNQRQQTGKQYVAHGGIIVFWSLFPRQIAWNLVTRAKEKGYEDGPVRKAAHIYAGGKVANVTKECAQNVHVPGLPYCVLSCF